MGRITHLLRSFCEAADDELLEGIDSADLLKRINADGLETLRQSDLTQALDRVDRLQSKIEVSPPVLTYSSSSRKVFLDRSFIFFRKYGEPFWPWQDEGDFSDDAEILDEPLDLD